MSKTQFDLGFTDELTSFRLSVALRASTDAKFGLTYQGDELISPVALPFAFLSSVPAGHICGKEVVVLR